MSRWRIKIQSSPKPLKDLRPSLFMTAESEAVEDSATAVTHMAVFISLTGKKLHIQLLKHPCKLKKKKKKFSSSWWSHGDMNKNNKTSVNSPVSYKDKNTRTTPRRNSFCFACIMQSQVKGNGLRGCEDVIRPRQCRGVWVYKAALLCWAGRTPQAESGQWIWWHRRQGWRKFGRPLHTVGEDKSPRWELLMK